MRYIAIDRSYGFRKRYWNVGEEFDSVEGEVVPHHFAPKNSYVPPEKPKDDTMAPLPMSFGKPVKPKGGFASNIEVKPPETMQTIATAKQRGPGRPKRK